MAKKAIYFLKLFFVPCRKNDWQAYFLRPDFLFILTIILLSLRLVILPFYINFPKSIFFADIMSSEIIYMLNKQRVEEGLEILKENTELTQAAKLKAKDMMGKNYFGHSSPSGVLAWDFIKEVGYDYDIAGENLAIGFLDSSEVHRAWNNSSLHRQNLLDPRFKEVGVAVLRGEFGERETTIVVQLFGKPQEALVQKTTVTLPTISEKKEILEEPEKEEIEDIKRIEGEGLSREELSKEKSMEVASLEKNASLGFIFSEFIVRRYGRISQRIVLATTTLVGSVLVLNLGIIMFQPFSLKFKFQTAKKILPGTVLAVIIMALLGITHKSFVIQFIPHNLRI